MTSSEKAIRNNAGHVFFSMGFRPFFLGGAIIAVLTPFITALAFAGVITFTPPSGIIAWHSHEMIYGYLSAVIAGFILTAVPNWTGRLPLLGPRLMGLFCIWLAGRISMLYTEGIPAAVIDSSFLLVLDVFLWREIVAGKNWRNAPICLLILFFATGNAIWHFENLQSTGSTFGLNIGIGAITILLALIGGRIIPNFTKNWLTKAGKEPKEMPFSTYDKLTIATLVVAILTWLIASQQILTGYTLITVSLLHLVRLARWQGHLSFSEPLVLILHIGYLWLVIGLGYLGLSILIPGIMPKATALHALTSGAMGVMTLAVMTRAVRGHTGRPLQADIATVIIYILVNMGALLRISTPFIDMPYAYILLVSSVLWGSAFALFSIAYGRYLLSVRLDA